MTNIELKEDSVIIDWIEYVKKDNQKEQVDSRPHKGRYRYPEDNRTDHYYIHPNLTIVYTDIDAFLSADYWNAFPSQELAEKELDKRKAIVTILRYISDNFWIFEPDWSDWNSSKYILFYDNDLKGFSIIDRCAIQYYSPIWYFSCGEHAEDIMKKFDKELRLVRDIR